MKHVELDEQERPGGELAHLARRIGDNRFVLRVIQQVRGAALEGDVHALVVILSRRAARVKARGARTPWLLTERGDRYNGRVFV